MYQIRVDQGSRSCVHIKNLFNSQGPHKSFSKTEKKLLNKVALKIKYFYPFCSIHDFFRFYPVYLIYTIYSAYPACSIYSVCSIFPIPY